MKRINISINVTKLKEALIKRPDLIAFKTKNGEACVNAVIWINAEPDKFGNDCSLQLNAPKDINLDEKIYLGNGKSDEAQNARKEKEEPKEENKEPEIKPEDVEDKDDLPF